MATVPYATVPRIPVVARPVGPPVVVARPPRNYSLLALALLGLILFLVAATIVLSLIPIYLPLKDAYAQTEIIPFTAIYRINNGTLPIGALTENNCAAIQNDLRTFAAANNGISPVTPTVTQCAVTGNSTVSRRRRQSQVSQGNVITITGFLIGARNCRGGQCLRRRADRFIALLSQRGTFFLTLAGANGTEYVFSLTVISATTGSAQIINGNTSSQSITALQNDIAILNYALLLEHLEANFYTRFQANFTTQDFVAANYSQETYTYFNLIASHEQAHVRILTSVISQLGSSPVPECIYNFDSVKDVPSYVAVARVLENTGTMAYDGAANGIADPRLREMAATVATVEARHAAYLNLIQGTSPFPSAFENATVPSVVLESVKPFLISCPYTIVLPTVPYIGAVAYTGTVPTSNSTSVSPYTNAMYVNDIRALNYALVAEHLESTFYNTYVSNFTSADFINNGFPDATIYFIMIREIENAHVNFLETTIRQRGGTPVSLCSYRFNVNNVDDFVNTSDILENTGVAAYDGAIDTITDPNLILYAATIATVEGRFASYLNDLLGEVPFPNVTEPALQPPQVVSRLSNYQTCPFPLELPVVLNPSTLSYNV